MTENDRNVWDRVLTALKSCKRDIENQLEYLDEDSGSNFADLIDELVVDMSYFLENEIDDNEETEKE